MVGGYKICPFCGEKISSNAKKCKYCGNAFFKEKRIGSFRNFKLCPYCEAEISETAKKCKYCGEWVNEEKKFEGYEYNGKTEKKDKNYSHEIIKKGYKICPYCGEEIRELAKKCRYCHEFLEEKKESEYESESESLKETKLRFDKNTNDSINNEGVKNEKKKNMTCGKRFGLYIFYVIRNIVIYLILTAMSSGYRTDPYSNNWFALDMLICFVIFVVETIRLISDCSKIKKGTYGK